jgi:N-acyl-D-aspartate/D-glutamate deacylase
MKTSSCLRTRLSTTIADALGLFRGRVDQGDRASFVIAGPVIGTRQSLVSAVRHTLNLR